MRKPTILLASLLLALLALALPALAGPTHKAVFVIGQSKYIMDGQEKAMDAAAFIVNDRTYVPVRYLALALGVAEKDIGWEEKAGTVTLALDDITLKLVVGSKTLYVNGQMKTMDVAPLIREGRTYLPARWVAEAFGYEVGWEPKSRAVLVGPKGNLPEPPKPPVNRLSQNGPIDLTAAKNGTLGVPENAVAPPGKWGFEPPIKRLDFEIGNRYATATRWDGSTFQVDLGMEVQLVVGESLNNDAMRKGYSNLPWDKAVIVPYRVFAAYVPFIPVAEAFGVPRGNIVWDGEHLGVWGFYGHVEDYKILTVGSKNGVCKGFADNFTKHLDEAWEANDLLDYPLFVKDGVPMVGIGTVSDIWLLFA
ncbi:MAG TPA: copper amine oxidase N-terminal domain-containing protein, partial [Desulfotomaculum sp.]|nr:copper amine oxidase N-terminal domain-containing protein [Desulfotomaculum sp.]